MNPKPQVTVEAADFPNSHLRVFGNRHACSQKERKKKIGSGYGEKKEDAGQESFLSQAGQAVPAPYTSHAPGRTRRELASPVPMMFLKRGKSAGEKRIDILLFSIYNITLMTKKMAESKNTIRRIIKTYLGVIAKNNIKIEKVYLFGSYARGKALEDSDIDIAIVSKDFSGDRFADRRRVVPLRRKIDRRLEPMPYTPENFKENDPLVVEILRNGIEVT